MEQILDSIKHPADVQKLSIPHLHALAAELRRMIIDTCAKNGGHLAPSLGTVDLTLALYSVFNPERDKFVWDVGHQAYAHKILTGRRENFATLRTLNGITGFPKRSESRFDAFGTGHASTSISAALGMSIVCDLEGKDYNVVAIIGDGAMSGGLSFEGLNNASETPNNLLIVLNDNNMSIDHSVGGMKHYLHQMHTSRMYNYLRFRTSQRLVKWGILNDSRRQKIIRFNNSLKSLLTNQQNVFDGMNIRYFGPSDGHNVVELVTTLRQIKDMKGPKLLHLHTIKGKGFQKAEENPTLYHAPGKYDPNTGEQIHDPANGLPPKYQDVFGHTLLELARANDKIVGVTPAMATGCSMNIMMNEMPDRTFDVGIAEGHAVTFSGGMAKDGLIPFCNIYSSFAQRAFDNIIHDVALNRLNVVLCLDRAGIVGQDGPTHHGAFDLAMLRPIPNLTICSPMNEHELRRLMFTAQKPDMGPFVIRYPRGRGVLTDWQCPLEEIPVGKGRCISEGEDTAILSLGPIGNIVVEAVEQLAKEGINVGHYDIRFLKPLDEELLGHVGRKYRRIITIEDGVRRGGLGSAVMEFMSERGLHPEIVVLGLPDNFVEHGTPEELYRITGLDKDSIIKVVRK